MSLESVGRAADLAGRVARRRQCPCGGALVLWACRSRWPRSSRSCVHNAYTIALLLAPGSASEACEPWQHGGSGPVCAPHWAAGAPGPSASQSAPPGPGGGRSQPQHRSRGPQPRQQAPAQSIARLARGEQLQHVAGSPPASRPACRRRRRPPPLDRLSPAPRGGAVEPRAAAEGQPGHGEAGGAGGGHHGGRGAAGAWRHCAAHPGAPDCDPRPRAGGQHPGGAGDHWQAVGCALGVLRVQRQLRRSPGGGNRRSPGGGASRRRPASPTHCRRTLLLPAPHTAPSHHLQSWRC